ncbi:hypothetical protein BJY52DRAFT_1385128 [Lactarius psammicola]|nr:hypothetical protein BJY52DRAFT_1385128 [Lactarius psammicola]
MMKLTEWTRKWSVRTDTDRMKDPAGKRNNHGRGWLPSGKERMPLTWGGELKWTARMDPEPQTLICTWSGDGNRCDQSKSPNKSETNVGPRTKARFWNYIILAEFPILKNWPAHSCFPYMYGSDHNMREVVMESSDKEQVEGSQCSDDRMDHMDIEAIDYFGSDDGIETTSGSSDDEQGADTSHSVEDMIKRRQHVTNGPGTLSSSGD